MTEKGNNILELLMENEIETIEFKEAKDSFSREKLMKYCVAIANEGGGRLVLGVREKPREAVGTNAFRNLGRIKKLILQKIKLRVEVDEHYHDGKRIVVFRIPARPTGRPLEYEGAYYMRVDDALVTMTLEKIESILKEKKKPDFSSLICPDATFSDLDQRAIDKLRELTYRKTRKKAVLESSSEQMLRDMELLVNGEVTYAAIILLGKKQMINRFLAEAEIIFEYRKNDTDIEATQRREFRDAFFNIYDEIWEIINLRNEIHPYRNGLFILDIPTFNEEVIREALLNAVSHRDYQMPGSIFIRLFPKRFEIVNPGGFPAGVTKENILYRHKPRNRRIAEVFQRCGLVERAGQGVDKMFRLSIRESKPRPDYSGSDDYQVSLTLRGEVQDPLFLKFLERVGKEKQVSFTLDDLLILDNIRKGEKVPENLSGRLNRLSDQGIIEPTSKQKAPQYILSRTLYEFIGEKGAYVRKKGLSKERNKALILQYFDEYGEGKLKDFMEVLHGLSRGQVQSLLKELRGEGKIDFKGRTKGAVWYQTHHGVKNKD